jgi:putative Holliday junction resolvase
MRYLGIDPGEKRTGLAISDPAGRIALPHRVLTHTGANEQLEAVLAAAKETEADVIVLGQPRSLSGEEGPAQKKVERFARRLSGRKLKVVLWDERRTTLQASQALHEMGVQAREQRGIVDQVAATLILQSYLDHINSSGPGADT